MAEKTSRLTPAASHSGWQKTKATGHLSASRCSSGSFLGSAPAVKKTWRPRGSRLSASAEPYPPLSTSKDRMRLTNHNPSPVRRYRCRRSAHRAVPSSGYTARAMTSPPASELDFDKADYGGNPAGVRCASCSMEIKDRYFEVNGATVCASCRRLITDLERPEGGLRRFIKATALGLAGGAAGASIWYAVATLFNMEIGLIAILVGWLVGSGVHRGAEGRGGLRYQLLAAFVAYASIVTTYIPPIYAEFAKAPEGAAAIGDTTAGQLDGSASSGPRDAAPAPAEEPGTASSEQPSLSGAFGSLLVAGAFLYAIAFAAPFLMGFENLIGILIIGFALHQAWRMNSRRVIEVKGPFRLAAARPPARAARAPDDIVGS